MPKSNPDVLTQAKSLLGVPNKQGGTTAKGLDGPGLAQLASKRAGLWLPARARRQVAHGVAIGRRLLEPGDLVFSRNFAREGVYVGGGVVITREPQGVTYLSMSRLGARVRRRRYDADTGYHAAFLAKQNLGAPYVFGGASPPASMSGLTMYVYAQSASSSPTGPPTSSRHRDRSLCPTCVAATSCSSAAASTAPASASTWAGA